MHECEMLKLATDKGYFYHPIQAGLVDGRMTLKVLPPAIEGPFLRPRSRRRHPSLIFSYCPFCGEKFEET